MTSKDSIGLNFVENTPIIFAIAKTFYKIFKRKKKKFLHVYDKQY